MGIEVAKNMHNESLENRQTAILRLGVVSFLNAKPLIAGLESDPGIRLVFDVPSRLGYLLDEGLVDAALVPIIDLARGHRRWQILSDACIGCDGETLTVRVFSPGPVERVKRLFVDGDSHTSVALAQIIWRQAYGMALDILSFKSDVEWGAEDAILLIGDKVVTRRLIGFDVQTDLGQQWKSLTGLPFVFAVWAAPVDSRDMSELSVKLSAARDAGVKATDMIAADFGPGMGWPVELAKRYLASRLKFRIGERQREAIGRFFALARRHGIISESREPAFA